jgi:putative transposase
MGNPHRFFGAGHPINLEEGGTIPDRCAVEVTFRTQEERFLLRPSHEVNEIILGCLGRAHHRYPELSLHVVSFLSNHGSFVCTPPNAFVLWSFMRDFLSTTAKRLNRHHRRTGTFWARRYRAIPILDEESLDGRFAYCLLQGTKENLVWSAREWPGVSSVAALSGGPALVARWRDESREYELERLRKRRIARAAERGQDLEVPAVPEVWHEYPVVLSPMPHWRPLGPEDRRARVAKIVRNDEIETRARHLRDGTQPLDVRAVLAAGPLERPVTSKRSPAPPCHTRTAALRRGFRAAMRAFVDSLRAVVHRLEPELERAGLPIAVSTPPLFRKPTGAMRSVYPRQESSQLERPTRASPLGNWLAVPG